MEGPQCLRVAVSQQMKNLRKEAQSGILKKSGPAETQDNTFAESALFLMDQRTKPLVSTVGTQQCFLWIATWSNSSLMKSHRSKTRAHRLVRMVVAAGAKVDSGWKKTTRPGVTPKSEPPISHVVKARTIPGYKASNNGTISGQSWWFKERRCVRLTIPDKVATKDAWILTNVPSLQTKPPDRKDGIDGESKSDSP